MWLVLGLAQGVKGLLSFLSAPLIGALSDTWGRKSFLLVTVGFTCLPLPFLFLSNLWWHIIAVAFSGLFAVTFSVVFAYVSDVTEPGERSSAYGLVRCHYRALLWS
jgi:MFS family permease